MKKYHDQYGQVWKRYLSKNREYIYRVSDGNIGGWFDGKGLTAI